MEFVVERLFRLLEYSNGNFVIFLMLLLLFIVQIVGLFFLSYFIQGLLHECGHMILAAIHGAELLEIRFGPIKIFKRNDKIKIRYTNCVDGGYCEVGETREVSKIASLSISQGGVLFNLVLTGFSIIGVIHTRGWIQIFMWLDIFTGIALILMNELPIGKETVNDGKITLSLLKGNDGVQAYYKYHKVQRILYYGSYMDLSFEDVKVESNWNDIVVFLALHQVKYYIANNDYRSALEIINHYDSMKKIIKKDKLFELKVEQFYIELMTKRREAVIRELMKDDGIATYMEKTKEGDSLRIRLAYEWLYKNNSSYDSSSTWNKLDLDSMIHGERNFLEEEFRKMKNVAVTKIEL